MRDLPGDRDDREQEEPWVVYVGAMTAEEWLRANDPARAGEPPAPPDPDEYVPNPYGLSHWVDDEGIVHASDASGTWTYDPQTGDVRIVEMIGTGAYGINMRAHAIRKRLDRGEPLTEVHETALQNHLVQEALRDRYPPGSTLNEK